MVLNACGLSCPEPVLMTAKAMDQATGPLAVQVDNQTAVENIKRLAANKGYSIHIEQTDEDSYLLTLRK